MSIARWIGARVKRIEDPKLLRGEGAYVGDLRLPGMVHAAFVRSPFAHARILRIDPGPALKLPGVLAVLTGESVRELGLNVPTTETRGFKAPPYPALAVDRVHYAGQPVAVVVAEDPHVAADAVNLLQVEFDPLPPVLDVEEARKDQVVLHEDLGTNVAYARTFKGGDVDRAFAEGEVKVRQRFVLPRLAPVPLEGRAVVASYMRAPGPGSLTVWTSTQVPHDVKRELAKALRIPANRLRVVAPDVGGGFGSKLNVYPEEVLVPFLAMRLGRPVKWVEERREGFMATAHGRAQVADLELAATREGRILGIRGTILADLGAYPLLTTPIVPPLTPRMLPGCYRIDALEVRLEMVYTTATPTGAYRGAGRPEAAYYIERLVDLLARELGMDPAEVRRRNFIPPEAFPYTTVTKLTYDSGNYAAALAKALEIGEYEAWRRRQEELRRQGRFLGIGLSTYVEICGFGPWEHGEVRVEMDGTVRVSTGTSPHGQGAGTGLAQIVAEILGVDMDRIAVVHGDTDLVPHGFGTGGSRSLVVGGSAVHLAATRVREKMVRIAAHLLEASPQDIVLEGEKAYVAGSPDQAVSFQEIVQAAYDGEDLPEGMEPGLQATAGFTPAGETYPFGAHLCVVEVDPEAGEVEILRYVAVDDCGRVINPLLVQGQLHGGIAQAIGEALYEGVVYNEAGSLATGTLAEYAVPKAIHLPAFTLDRTETPTQLNPLGAKGIGEAGTIGATPAVVNAVIDALTPFGIRHLDVPLWPEKIWRAIHRNRPPSHPSARRVQDALRALGSDAEVIELSESTRTATDAARAVGTTVAQIVKSLIFKAGEEPVLVLVSGVNRVSMGKLQSLVGAPVSKADGEWVRRVTGFAIGGVPPIGHPRPMRTFLDEDLLQFREVWAAGGTPNAVFRISPEELIRLTRATIADVKE